MEFGMFAQLIVLPFGNHSLIHNRGDKKSYCHIYYSIQVF